MRCASQRSPSDRRQKRRLTRPLRIPTVHSITTRVFAPHPARILPLLVSTHVSVRLAETNRVCFENDLSDYDVTIILTTIHSLVGQAEDELVERVRTGKGDERRLDHTCYTYMYVMTASCFEPRCEFFVGYNTCTVKVKRRLSCMVCCFFCVCVHLKQPSSVHILYTQFTFRNVVSVHVHVCTLIYSLYICIDAAMLAVVVVALHLHVREFCCDCWLAA